MGTPLTPNMKWQRTEAASLVFSGGRVSVFSDTSTGRPSEYEDSDHHEYQNP